MRVVEGETVETAVVPEKEKRIILRPDEGVPHRKGQIAFPAHLLGGGVAQADPFPLAQEESLVALALRVEGIGHLAGERSEVLGRVEDPHGLRLGARGSVTKIPQIIRSTHGRIAECDLITHTHLRRALDSDLRLNGT
jgi:hypothetical protein